MALTNDGRKSIIITVVLSVVATIFVVLRMMMRRGKGVIGLDDWLLLFGVFMLYLQDVGAILLAVKGGEGKPFATLTPDEMEWLFKMFFWPELGYTILITTIKVSILVSFQRIFGKVTWVLRTIYVLYVLVIAWGLAIFFTVIFQCQPIDKAWKPMKPGKCIELIPFLWGNSVSNNILDWAILLLPVIPVWKLQMEAKQKALVLCAFFLGSLACAASLVRAVTTGTIDLTDISRSVFNASVWTYIEPCLGIMSACLPFLANSLGQRLLNISQTIGSLGSRAIQLVTFGSNSSRSRVPGLDTQNSTQLQNVEARSMDNASMNSKAPIAHNTRELV